MRQAKNKRQRPRYYCRGNARIQPGGTPGDRIAPFSEISARGCYIFMDDPPPMGTRLELCLQVEEIGFLTRGVVVYSDAGQGVGVHLPHLSKEEEARLEGLLARVAALFHKV